jgi:hypothetical protein
MVPSTVQVSLSKRLRITAWSVQIVLALTFGAVGIMKLTQPIAALAQGLGWPGVVPSTLVRVIGLSEFLGAVGLILPAATGFKPALTPLAAAGLLVVMCLASLFHISRGEVSMLPVTVVLGALAGFVAWARTKKGPLVAS